MARTTKQDKVRELQRTLYRAAKADPERRFHALYDKVYRRDVLEHAWELVRANKGAAGVGGQTIADVEEYGVARLLDELAADLKDGKWRPLAASRSSRSSPSARPLCAGGKANAIPASPRASVSSSAWPHLAVGSVTDGFESRFEWPSQLGRYGSGDDRWHNIGDEAGAGPRWARKACGRRGDVGDSAAECVR